MTAGKRRTAREMAVQMLFQSDLGGSPLPQIFNSFDLSEYLAREEPSDKKQERPATPVDARAEFARTRRRVEEAFQYAQDLVRGTIENQEKIDDLIRAQADNWRLERMPAVDRNILRLAIYEMLHREDIPPVVSINEAVDIAKKFSTEDSGKFVNGILDKVKGELMRPARIVS